MGDDDAVIRDTFMTLADLLEPQPLAAWDAPSLCERWRVRNVVAHVTNAARYGPQEYMTEVQADGGNFAATTDRLAERDGALSPEVLLENLRDRRLHQWVPPGGDRSGALSHVVIHGLDLTVPLGMDQWLAEEPRRRVLEVLTAGGVHANFGTTIDGVRLEATDIDWSHGSGRRVSGTTDALILVLSGRDVPHGLRGALP